MSALSRSSALLKARPTTQPLAASLHTQYGRAASYRRISSLRPSPSRSSALAFQDTPQSILRSPLATLNSPNLRLLHTSPSLLAKVGKPRGGSAAAEAPEPPKPTPEEVAEAARAAAEAAAQSAPKEEPSSNSEQESSSSSKQEDSSKSSSEGEAGAEGEEAGDKKKKDAPPPPPHGDKTPWQVFTDTLRTEFKASKEWNDSTKQLAGSVQEFNESEAVRRARLASEAVSSTTGKVLKGTGKVVGQSVGYAWNTMPVKGLRTGVSATGRGVEKITRPLRETEAFKSVANVIDDGSSSRYGGWTEKEQRRKQREAREAREIAEGRRPAKTEKVEEDILCALLFHLPLRLELTIIAVPERTW
jgi:import inner membrane translocase subunit TIM44